LSSAENLYITVEYNKLITQFTLRDQLWVQEHCSKRFICFFSSNYFDSADENNSRDCIAYGNISSAY